jgi:hypothetical protein
MFAPAAILPTISRLFTECLAWARLLSSSQAGVKVKSTVWWRFAPELFYTPVRVHSPAPGTAAHGEPQELKMDAQSTIKLVAGVLAVVLVGIVVLRRKGKKTKSEDDEF